MQSPMPLVVILATGGTIAGAAAASTDTTGYVAGALGVEALVAGVPELAARRIEAESVAALDSKDMDFATWQRLAARVAFHVARPGVAGIVITHGTDTVEETAYFLQRVLAPAKPVVLTAAMRPATALSADGPANLLDAVTLAGTPGVHGVVLMFAGAAWHPIGLRKVHTLRTDAFAGGDCGPVARMEGGVLRTFRAWPEGDALGLARIAAPPASWPRVEIVLNHAGADGRLVDAAVAAGARGVVVAGTGHGSISARLEQALVRARERGVEVRRASRCAFGPVLPKPSSEGDADDESVGDLSAVQARVALLLHLLEVDAGQAAKPGAH
jgi:L-asparaginase